MSQIEENEVKVTEPVVETEEETVAESISAQDEEVSAEGTETPDTVPEEITTAEESKKKKKPLLQVPVIISLCLVVCSLLAFFAYKLLWITEPEGTTWVWSSETDNVNWYYEFKEGGVFKAYVGSFEITSSYSKNKSDESKPLLNVSSDIPYTTSMGCVFFGADLRYTVSGSRLFGNQEMMITYVDDPEAQEFVLKQTNGHGGELELPKDFTENADLTGEWINIYSTEDMKQTISFNKDGSMKLREIYEYADGTYSEICRNCTYTVEDGSINITWIAEEPVVHHSEYTIEDGVLMLDGAAYYREGNHPATPDQTADTK